MPNGVVTVHQYDAANRLTDLTHTATDDTVLSSFCYELDGVGNHTRTVETLTGTTRVVTNTYDSLNRLIGSDYSTGEQFVYALDALSNRTLVTSTTPLSGTVVTTYTFDAANRLSDRQVSDGRSYTYDWSNRGQMLAEWTVGYPVRTFTYDSAGRMTQATLFTLTTRFTYDGDGARHTVEVVGHGTTTYTLDYARGHRILAETTPTSTVTYLYGHDCLGESRDDEWLYYLNDAIGYVRQGADEDGQAVSHWLFDPDGTVLEGPEGPVSHLICGGVYDWSTGLIFKDGRYFDPSLGIWLALMPLLVLQSWRGGKRKRERKRRGWLWYVLVLLVVGVGGLAGCGSPPACAPIAGYARDPRLPGPHDADILDASVIIRPVVGGVVQPASLGTIVGHDGPDWIIYTHNHFDQLPAGVPLSDPSVDVIRIHNHDQSNHVNLLMIGANPDAQVSNVTGQRTELRVRMTTLDGTAGPRIGSPIARIDGAAANIGDQVDIAYFAPAGAVSNQVEIWHTRIVDRPADTSPFPGTVAVLGIPVSGDVRGPGAHGDSGGGLFLNGEHIGNIWNWIFNECSVNGKFIMHIDAFWLVYLNP